MLKCKYCSNVRFFTKWNILCLSQKSNCFRGNKIQWKGCKWPWQSSLGRLHSLYFFIVVFLDLGYSYVIINQKTVCGDYFLRALVLAELFKKRITGHLHFLDKEECVKMIYVCVFKLYFILGDNGVAFYGYKGTEDKIVASFSDLKRKFLHPFPVFTLKFSFKLKLFVSGSMVHIVFCLR
jgi:hypothetical protein